MSAYGFVKTRWVGKYGTFDDFEKAYSEYGRVPSFKSNENINDVFPKGISEECHYIMRLVTQYHLTQAFEAMKIDLNDPNIAENAQDGNIGSAGRIAKIWCGANLEDTTELGHGRWTKPPRLAKFPNTGNKSIPITKKVDIVSNCSHHFISFNTITRPDSRAIISYIPNEFVLGISKLQRITDWLSRRFWLQEALTDAIYGEVSKAAQTDSVLVAIVDAVHGCETLRGAKSQNGAFTSMSYGGKFVDIEIRNTVLNN